jgi:hypothetical protein
VVRREADPNAASDNDGEYSAHQARTQVVTRDYNLKMLLASYRLFKGPLCVPAKLPRIARRSVFPIAFSLVLSASALPVAPVAAAATVEVCFSPEDDCAGFAERAIESAVPCRVPSFGWWAAPSCNQQLGFDELPEFTIFNPDATS